MPYKVELIDLEGSVVGFFEVDPGITLAALAVKLEEAAWGGCQSNSHL